jgi:hypothetical protein
MEKTSEKTSSWLALRNPVFRRLWVAIGSLVSGALIIPWARAKYSPQRITTAANFVLLLNCCLMAFVHRPGVFLVVAPYKYPARLRNDAASASFSFLGLCFSVSHLRRVW